MKNLNLTPLVLMGCLFALTTTHSFATVITVDDDGPADYSTIQEAIDSVFMSGTIEVQPGTYYENISYYGKTIVLTSTGPNNPDIVDTTIIDGDSSGNVVTFNNGEDPSCILAGFTIQNGQNGIYCYYSEPLIKYCVIKTNNNGLKGPGAPNIQHTIVKENTAVGIYDCDGDILNCEITENLSYGLRNCDGTKENCIISGNSSSGLYSCSGQFHSSIVTENGGDGLYSCSGQFHNSTVSGNGAYGFYNCSGTVKDCLIMNNAQLGYYGSNTSSLVNCLVSGNGDRGIYFWYGSHTATNCTIVGNKGDGIYGYGGYVSNNIVVRNEGYGLIGNITSQYNEVWQNLSGDYSTVVPGTGDISQDPIFAVNGYWDMGNNWVEGDYHLRSTVGRWDGNDWVIDTVGSPCIDTGDPNSPIGLEPYPNGARINMGVYGGTAQASKSPGGIVVPVCVNPPPMDFSGDCRVDIDDFQFFVLEWLNCGLNIQEECWD